MLSSESAVIMFDRTVPCIPGAKVFRGSLHITRDNSAEELIEAIVPETGHVTPLFDRNLGEDYEAEGIAFIRPPTVPVMVTAHSYGGRQCRPRCAVTGSAETATHRY